MISKIMLFLILTVFINTIKTSASNTYYTNLHLSDTVKLINRNPNKSTQIYFFTDLSACHICNFNINELSKRYRNECDFYVFINKADNSDIVSLKSIFDDNINLIGDEYGIYKEYYKIKYQPLILVLDFNSIVIGWDNIKSIELDLDIIIENNKQQYTNSKILRKNNELQEISRLRVKNNNEELVTSLFRDCLFNDKEKGFVLINMRQPEIQIIDSTGIIQKIIKLFLKENNLIDEIHDISWASQDSILFVYGSNREHVVFQLIDLISDSILLAKELRRFDMKLGHFESFNAKFLKGKNCFINSSWFFKNKSNRHLSKSDTVGKIINLNGNVIKKFDAPDTSYILYKRSYLFENILTSNLNSFYSIQDFTNTLKVWNKEGLLLKTLNLDLGEHYRLISGDIINFSNDDILRHYWNSVSVFQKVLVENTTGNILLSFKNETYPDSAYDFMSDECKWEIFINIYDNNGSIVNKSDIILSKGSIPFHFDNNFIYTTEMSNNKLEIVIYLFSNRI